MSTEQAAARPASAPTGAIIVLAITGLFYAAMMANLGEMQNPNTDAMGRGLASGFGLVFVFLEWMFLAVLLLIGGVKGAMPNWAAIAVAILHPLSGIAAVSALSLLDHEGDPHYQLVPGLLAPVLAAYALWSRLPVLHRRLPPLPTSLAALAAVALLSLMPLLHPL